MTRIFTTWSYNACSPTNRDVVRINEIFRKHFMHMEKKASLMQRRNNGSLSPPLTGESLSKQMDLEWLSWNLENTTCAKEALGEKTARGKKKKLLLKLERFYSLNFSLEWPTVPASLRLRYLLGWRIGSARTGTVPDHPVCSSFLSNWCPFSKALTTLVSHIVTQILNYLINQDEDMFQGNVQTKNLMHKVALILIHRGHCSSGGIQVAFQGKPHHLVHR